MAAARLLCRRHPLKPWVVSAPTWQQTNVPLETLVGELINYCPALAVAKPSRNLYLGGVCPGVPSPLSAALLNLASHGEMAVEKVFLKAAGHSDICPLIDLLPSQVEVNGLKHGRKLGKFLNHFGYRKRAIQMRPESLADHAWIAAAMSYATEDELVSHALFDTKGGFAAGGCAGVMSNGYIFTGSAVKGPHVDIPAATALEVSLFANGAKPGDLVQVAVCETIETFRYHRFYDMLKNKKI